MSRSSNKIEIGGVARAHGIRGEIAVHTHDPESTILGDLTSLYVGGVAYEVAAARNTSKGWLVALVGVADRNAAEALQGKIVEVDRAHLDLDDDDVLLCDLVGCRAQLADGTPWGTITAIDAGPQDRLVIRDGDVERLLPLVDAFVTNIDLDAGIVTVAPPDGLPEERVREQRAASPGGVGDAGGEGASARASATEPVKR